MASEPQVEPAKKEPEAPPTEPTEPSEPAVTPPTTPLMMAGATELPEIVPTPNPLDYGWLQTS